MVLSKGKIKKKGFGEKGEEKMAHNFLFIMSLSGSVILILYFLTYPIAKRCFSLAWRYLILKIAIAFYLLPFPLCLSQVRSIVYKFFPQVADKMYLPNISSDSDYLIYFAGDSIYTSLKMKGMLFLLFGFGVFSFAIVLMHIFQYRKVSKICLGYSNAPVEQEYKNIFEEIKRGLGIKRNVSLSCSEYCKSPITMGMLFPIVVIPSWTGDEKNRNLYEDVIKHELVHIKHRDLLIKFLGIMIIAIHWFNPLAYVLYHEISNISEMYCDSIVVKGKEEKARKEYGELLLRLATKKQAADSKFIVGIIGGNSKMAFKRRILEMKEVRKNRTVLSVILMTIICMAGGLSVCAYDTPMYMETCEEEDCQKEGFDFWFTEGELKFDMEELPYEQFFTDNDGKIHEINKGENISRVSCSHKYVTGTTTSHKKNQSGGCAITYCKARRCLNCGNVIKDEEINTVTYKICPHD